jgi:predicted dehydrogenase
VNITPEQKEQARRSFLKAVASPPVMTAVGAATAVDGPLPGGPVRVGFVGVGQQGRVLLDRSGPAHVEVRALCDINPGQLAKADEVLQKAGRPPAHHYAEWREMLEKEDIEAVIMAPPLWKHAELTAGVLEAGKHVLCEKMMAWDEDGCTRMSETAQKSGRVLEIGYQRYYNPTYLAAYHGVIKPGLLGEVYHARLVWHRNGNWRRQGQPPSPDYDPTPWGYPTFEHLFNWRLYWRYSKGLFAELASHQVNVTNWFLGATPERVEGAGGIGRFNDGREVQDHVYATFEYPGGRTVTFSSIESNAFEGTYEAFFGTKGTLIMSGEREAYLFNDGQAPGAVTAPQPSELEPDQGRAAAAIGWTDLLPPAAETQGRRLTSSRLQIATFCAAIRSRRPVACGPVKAMSSARACIRANESAQKHAPMPV